MKVREIFVTRKRTINTGNFESETAEVGMTAELEEGEKVSRAMEKLTEMVTEERHKIEKQIVSEVKARKKAWKKKKGSDE